MCLCMNMSVMQYKLFYWDNISDFTLGLICVLMKNNDIWFMRYISYLIQIWGWRIFFFLFLFSSQQFTSSGIILSKSTEPMQWLTCSNFLFNSYYGTNLRWQQVGVGWIKEFQSPPHPLFEARKFSATIVG